MIEGRREARMPLVAEMLFEREDCLAAIARRRAAIVEAKAARRIDGAAADWFLTLDDTLADEIGKGLHRKDGA